MSDPTVELDRFYTVEEAARIAGVRLHRVYRAIATGRLAAERSGTLIRVRGAAVLAWRPPQSVASPPPTGWLTLAEAARIARAHPQTIVNHIYRGTITAQKVAGAWAIDPEVLARWQRRRARGRETRTEREPT